MPRRRQDVPATLRGRAVSSETLRAQLGRSRMRRDDVMHPHRGVVGLDLELSSVRDRCRAYHPLLREGQLFSHVTALALFEVPLPSWIADEPLHLAVRFPRTPPRGVGVHGHSLRTPGGALHRDGLPLVDPASAWCQAAAQLSREDLVAAGDALVTGRRLQGRRAPGLTTREQLAEVANRRVRSPGAAKVAWALSRIRVGVDSRPESLLRLQCVRGRLPEPAVDHPLDVGRGLRLHADLAYPAARIALEYEGDIHRTDRVTWHRDLERRELFEDQGWRVVRVTSADLFGQPAELTARLRRLIASRTP